ncbi:hypothetical protein IscW_ISCW017563, partial [Ixodes scapularis]
MRQGSMGLRAELQEVVTSYRLLFDESGLPGLRFVLGFHLNPRRLAWLALYATLFILTMRDTHRLLADYYTYDDCISQEVLQARSPDVLALYGSRWGELSVHTKRVLFPAVTVCNMNPWRKSKVCSESSFVSKSAKALISELCNSVHRNVTIQMPEEDLEMTQKLKTWISAEQRRNLSRAGRMGHQIEDMILECRVHDGDCLSAQLLDLRLVPRYGNCYCLGCNSSRFSWQARKMSDPEQGLRMSLNMEPNEFLPLTVEAGFYVMINQPGAEEEVFNDAVFVPPGATTYIAVAKTTSKNLEPPYKNPCQQDWPKELKKYVAPGVAYTKRACDEYCYQVHIFETCGCRSFKHIRVLVPQVMNVPLATLFQNIGGLMGFYLGYSSLHIFQVLEVIFDGAWSSLSRILARRRRA